MLEYPLSGAGKIRHTEQVEQVIWLKCVGERAIMLRN